MSLTTEQIQALIRAPKNRVHIDAAIRDNDWQTFHACPATDPSDAGPYLHKFNNKAARMLKKKGKIEMFKNILSFPLPSNQIVSKGSDEWNKIFTAQDRSIEYYFEKQDMSVDFASYLNDIGIQNIIEQNIFTLAKQAVNTLVVVDLPPNIIEIANQGKDEEANNTTPIDSDNYVSPYVYLLDMSYVIDADEDNRGNIEYVIFYAGKDRKKVIAIDDEFYRVGTIEQDEIKFEAGSPHGLGYCPVKTIWSDNISPHVPIRRFNSVTEALSEMDKLVMSDVFSQHTDLYAGFPILWRFVAKCMYEEIEGDPCRGGKVPYYNNNGERKMKDCPACASNKDLVGPGTLVDMPMPVEKEQPIIKDPINFVMPDTLILEYNQKKIEKLRQNLMWNLAGGELQTSDKDAINEDQVRSQYEKKQDILKGWVENFQKIHKFIVDTIGKLRYGNTFKGSTINYGNNFFLINMNIAVREYGEAKEAGLPMYLVIEKRKAIDAIYSGNSPEKKDRMKMLQLLEPYLDVPLETIELDTFEYELKANFSRYIDIFEANWGPITLFGYNAPLMKRITTITKHLLDYVKESKRETESFLREFGRREEVSGDGSNAKGSGRPAKKGGSNSGNKARN